MTARIVKVLFFLFFVKPLALFALGLNVFFKERLPASGPAIIAANHNSHLDTLVLMSLYPLSKVHKIRPVAAADYFFKSPIMAWLSTNFIGIIPLDRSGNSDRSSLFNACHEALDQGHILIIFPEGSRGKPEELSRIKKGLYHLVQGRQTVQVTPVAMYGLGLSLPKGEALFVPLNCDIAVGEPLAHTESALSFSHQLSNTLEHLLQQCPTRKSS